MIVFDAVFINNGGGKVLLDLLISELEKTDNNIFYLLDKRVEKKYKDKLKNALFIEGSIFKRHLFYFKNKKKIKKVFCFGNIPPSIKLNATVTTYLHQKLFISIPKELPIKDKLIFFLKSKMFNFLLKNTTSLIVQSKLMKEDFIKKHAFKNVQILPFFEEINVINSIEKKENIFLYISLASKHKNHLNLLNAFVLHFNKNKTGELHLTVSNENKIICSIINNLNSKGYPVVNHGFVSFEQKKELYKKSKYVIYPSLIESFGLGIIEAIQFNCKLITANLDYVFQISNPSLVFNPLDVNDIAFNIEKALTTELLDSKLIIKNKLKEIIDIIK